MLKIISLSFGALSCEAFRITRMEKLMAEKSVRGSPVEVGLVRVLGVIIICLWCFCKSICRVCKTNVLSMLKVIVS